MGYNTFVLILKCTLFVFKSHPCPLEALPFSAPSYPRGKARIPFWKLNCPRFFYHLSMQMTLLLEHIDPLLICYIPVCLGFNLNDGTCPQANWSNQRRAGNILSRNVGAGSIQHLWLGLVWEIRVLLNQKSTLN